MLYKLKRLLIVVITVSITFFVLWKIVVKISPTINPPEASQESIERDYRGAIKIDIK
jgi:hypothetical protein